MKNAFIDQSTFKRLLIALDLVALWLLCFGVFYLRIGEWPSDPRSYVFIFFASIVVVLFSYLFGNYLIQTKILQYGFLIGGLATVLCSGFVFAAVVFLFNVESSGVVGRGVMLGSLLGFYLYSSAFRLLLFNILRIQSQNQKWLVFISKKYLDSFLKDIEENHLGENYHILLAEDGPFSGEMSRLPNFVGGAEKTNQLYQAQWFGVILALTDEDINRHSQVLVDLRFAGVKAFDLATYYEMKWQKVPVYYIKQSWFIFSEGFHLIHSAIGLRVKRIFDIIGAGVLFLLTFPLMVATWIVVRMESSGPAIYSQERTGLNNKSFIIYKFRSMKLDAEKDGAKWASKNDIRVTRVGRFLRKSRLDELPQLWNVFRGDMSFIGPRPERPEFNKELEKEIPHYKLRHLLKPGVSGWAQVMYPYGACIKDSKEKLQYDLFYIKSYSLFLDLKIIFKTMRVVLGGKGR